MVRFDVDIVVEQPERLKRRLAAVLVADVAGYSRLMQADETGTHMRWQIYLAGSEELVGSHRGRCVKTTGDGFIAEFPSLLTRLMRPWLSRTDRVARRRRSSG